MKIKRELEGIVTSNKMEKTVIIKVAKRFPHPTYSKVITRNKKYKAHTEKALEIGEKVKIRESRPFSKTTSWIVVE